MTASILAPNPTILGWDSLLDMAGVLAGQQHCVARSLQSHTIAKLHTGRSGRSGRSGRLSPWASAPTPSRGGIADA